MTTVQRAAELCLKLANGFMQCQYDPKLKVDGSTARNFEYPKMIHHNQSHVTEVATFLLDVAPFRSCQLAETLNE